MQRIVMSLLFDITFIYTFSFFAQLYTAYCITWRWFYLLDVPTIKWILQCQLFWCSEHNIQSTSVIKSPSKSNVLPDISSGLCYPRRYDFPQWKNKNTRHTEGDILKEIYTNYLIRKIGKRHRNNIHACYLRLRKIPFLLSEWRQTTFWHFENDPLEKLFATGIN